MYLKIFRYFLLGVIIFLVTACSESPVKEIPATPALTETLLTVPTSTPVAPSLPPLQVITVNNAGQVRLLRTLEIPGFRRASYSQCNPVFSPLGHLLAATCMTNNVAVWDLDSLRLLYRLYQSAEHVVDCQISPDGQTLACGKFSNPRTIDLFDLNTGEMVGQLRQHYLPIWEIAFDPDGQHLVSGTALGYDDLHGHVTSWDLSGGQRLWDHLPDYGDCLSLSFHPSGDTIAVSSILGLVEILDAGTGELLITLKDASRHIGDLTYSPSGRYLAASTDDSQIFIWDTDGYQLLTAFPAHSSYVNGVDFSDDETLLVSSSDDSTVAIWAVEDFRLLAMLEGHEGTVLRVDINPEGTLIASASWDGTVRLWGIPLEE
jgi:WD40 repeat protein